MRVRSENGGGHGNCWGLMPLALLRLVVALAQLAAIEIRLRRLPAGSGEGAVPAGEGRPEGRP